MPAIFPLIRGALLGSVAIWTLVVLGIAIHFQMSFIPSPEMTFVPLAVFAAASTLVVFLLICVSSCIGRLKPIAQTRWELVWLGILAVLWLALGGLTSKTDTVEYEVECWTEEDGVVIDDDVDAYSNDVYHARYRVLQAFSLINALLLLGLFLFMLIFAIWHHKRGRWVIWTTPTNMVGWFDKPSSGDGLPAPVTGKQGRDHKYKQLLEKDDSKYTPIPAVTRKDSKNRYNNDIVEGKTQITGSNGYKIWVPAKNTSSDPEKVPIIAKKMLQERNAPPVAAPQPVRRASERQAADLARQESRRDRAAREEAAGVELPRRQEIARKASGGHQPAVARPAGELRRGLSTPAAGTRPNAGRQGSTPAVVRPDARRQGSSQPQPTNNNAARPGVARQNTTQAPKRR